SFSEPKQFELPLYKGNAHPPLVFDRAGVVVLGCNIHDSMLGYILVVDTPHFASTDAQGSLSLDGLSPDEYSLHVWTPRLRPNDMPAPTTIKVAADGTQTLSIKLEGELAAMAKVLRHAAVAAATAALAGAALADDSSSDRNRFQFEIDASYVHADSPLGAWTDGGLGKLRYAETNDGLESTRVFRQYRGRIANTLSATVIADYQSDASSGIDVTEAYMDWRPVPKSENQQQIRFGAFYP